MSTLNVTLLEGGDEENEAKLSSTLNVTLLEEGDEENEAKLSSTVSSSSSLCLNSMSRASLLLSIASFGYALPWVALGSLLAYFKHHGGDQYYVAIYCCYYAPGLPIAILQTHFDSSYDMKYSSRVTFAVRGLLCWSLTLVIIPLLRVHLLVPEVCLPFVGALGVSTWSLHGSASQLASLVPGDGGVCAQQIGFALPAAVTFAVLEGFDMGGGEENLHPRP